MAKPTQSIFPIENGKLLTVLDANNFQIINLDTGNLNIPGGPGGGNDTGTTTAILKGDGNHGFADAIPGTDYATVGSIDGKEDTADHDADIAILTADIATLTTAVGTKADSATTTAALALKANQTDLAAYITSNDAALATLTTAVGNKADSASVSTALALKANITYVDDGLAVKEDLLPTSSNDGFVLVRDADETWRFVDPVTLGSTNFTGADGATHSNTTFNSASAIFTTNDTGKTIVCSGNIPDDTTITFVNSTTVTLSSAATTTASGLTFTILNRYLSNATGTVTSVSVSNTAVNDLLTTNVTNPTSSPAITLTKPNVAANTFYGSNVNGAPVFMSAATARTALGGTTVGQAIFQLTNPSTVGYIRTNADNTVTARSTASTLGDLGAESALTFSTPLTRSINVISIPAATTIVSGHLTSTDWTTFNSKLSGGRTITTTTPLTIDGLPSADLSANRTLAIPRAAGNADNTGKVNGYLHGDDFVNFLNKPPNTRSISTTAPLTIGGISGSTVDLSANRTIAIPRASATVNGYLHANDFLTFQSTNVTAVLAGNGTTPLVLSFPANRIVLNVVLTQTLQVTLPPALNYSDSIGFPFIEFIDISTGLGGGATANFGIVLNVTSGSGDLIDNATSLTLSKGIGYIRVNSNGFNRWLTTKYYVDSFKDPTDPSKKVIVDVSNLTPGVTGTLNLANGNSTTVNPGLESLSSFTPTANTFITDISATGAPITSNVYGKDVFSRQDDITSVTGNAHTVPPASGIDNIRLSVPLTAPLTVTLPPTSDYPNNSQPIYFYDATGTVSAFNVTLIGVGTDTVNGGASVLLNRDYDSRRMIPNVSTHNWTIETYGGSQGNGLNVGLYASLSDTFLIHAICDQGLNEQHWNLTGTVGVGTSRIVKIENARNGERFRINYTHYTTNDTFSIQDSATPGTATGTGGLGLLTLSTQGAGTLDTVTGTVIANNKILVDNPSLNLTYAAASTFNASADISPASPDTGTIDINIGSTSNNKYQIGEFIGGLIPGSSSYICGRIDLYCRQIGAAPGNIIAEIAPDAVRIRDSGATITAGSATVFSTSVALGDSGQRVQSVDPAAIPGGAYIGAVTAGTSFTLVTTKGGATPLPASTSGTGGVDIFGRPGTTIATFNPVVASTVPAAYASGPVSFTGTTCPITAGTVYRVCVHTDATTFSSANCVQWRVAGSNTGYWTKNGATLNGATLAGTQNGKTNFITYK